jgi:hypothetical protein
MKKGKTQRTQLGLEEVDRETCDLVKIVAAQRKISMGEYVRRAIRERLSRDLQELERDQVLAFHANSDPVLAELWNNELDAAYDKLYCAREEMRH